MQTLSGTFYRVMANNGEDIDDEGRLTHRMLRDNQKRAEDTAKINDLQNGKRYHSFIRQVELAIKLFTKYGKRVEADYVMPDELKCEFLYSHLGDEPGQPGLIWPRHKMKLSWRTGQHLKQLSQPSIRTPIVRLKRSTSLWI